MVDHFWNPGKCGTKCGDKNHLELEMTRALVKACDERIMSLNKEHGLQMYNAESLYQWAKNKFDELSKQEARRNIGRFVDNEQD